MKSLLLTVAIVLIQLSATAQAYIKLVPNLGDTTSLCNNGVEMVPYGATGPYMITWWDNHWQPGTGLHVQNVCEGTILTAELLDIECRDLTATLKILPSSSTQVYLDTVIMTLPSTPGACDGSLSFHFSNVLPTDTRGFSSSGSGGTTVDTVFTGLCEDSYGYFISRGGSEIASVRVSLQYAPVLPCTPFSDSLIITDPISGPGNCDARIEYNTSGTETYWHYIYKPVGGGSVVANGNPAATFFDSLCAGPHIVYTEIYGSDNYSYSSTIFVDNPTLADSTWGNPGSSTIDTIYLDAVTNCGVNYTTLVDSVYISQMNHIAANQYEFEITVLQDTNTILSYQTASVDTSHQLCFDITFFCADSAFNRASTNEMHNYIFFTPSEFSQVGIEEAKPIAFRLYPVPAREFVTLDQLPAGANRIRVLSMEGKIVVDEQTNNQRHSLRLPPLSPGLYFVTVENSGRIQHQKMLVH